MRFFQKRNKPAKPESYIVTALSSHIGMIVSIIEEIEPPIANRADPGVFVASIATLSLMGQGYDEIQLDRFNRSWAEHVSTQSNVNVSVVTRKLQENYPVYSELFMNVLDPQGDKDRIGE